MNLDTSTKIIFQIPACILCKDYTILAHHAGSLEGMITNLTGSLEIVYDHRRPIEKIVHRVTRTNGGH